VPGLYGIQCIPHLPMGMVMLIQVGEPNADKPLLPADLPARAKAYFITQLEKLEAGR